MPTDTRNRRLLHETGPTLPTSFTEQDGQRRTVRIIGPGWGASGYYSETVLERDGPDVFQAGTHMYLDHPSIHEDTGVRSVRDLAAVLAEDAVWMENGPAGPGLYADVDLTETHAPLIDDLAEHIGVSIRAYGEAERGEVEGRRGMIVERLHAAESVDFVTRAGAGGVILPLLESAGTLVEARNTIDWFEALLHLDFTRRADRMLADGRISRDERVALSSAIGDALDTFHTAVVEAVPQLADRDPDDEPAADVQVTEHASGMSANDLRDALNVELDQQFGGDNVHVWLRDYGDDWAVYDLDGDTDSPGKFRIGYQVDDGTVTLSGDPVEVRVETTYVPETNDPDLNEEEDPMDITDEMREEIRDIVTDTLAEANSTFEENETSPDSDELAEARDRALRAEAREQARTIIDDHDQADSLPARARTRIAEQATADLPTDDDGELDVDTFGEQVTGLVDDELSYLAEALGIDPDNDEVVDLGEGADGGTDTPDDEQLNERIGAVFGV